MARYDQHLVSLYVFLFQLPVPPTPRYVKSTKLNVTTRSITVKSLTHMFLCVTLPYGVKCLTIK